MAALQPSTTIANAAFAPSETAVSGATSVSGQSSVSSGGLSLGGLSVGSGLSAETIAQVVSKAVMEALKMTDKFKGIQTEAVRDEDKLFLSTCPAGHVVVPKTKMTQSQWSAAMFLTKDGVCVPKDFEDLERTAMSTEQAYKAYFDIMTEAHSLANALDRAGGASASSSPATERMISVPSE